MGKTLFWVVAFLGGLLVTRVLAQLAAKKMYNDSLRKPAQDFAAKHMHLSVRVLSVNTQAECGNLIRMAG
jgi:hypothetical protein